MKSKLLVGMLLFAVLLANGPILLAEQQPASLGMDRYVQDDQKGSMASGVVLVGIKSDIRAANHVLGALSASISLQQALDRLSIQTVDHVLSMSSWAGVTANQAGMLDVYRLELAQDMDMTEAMHVLSAHPNVVYVEPDYLAHTIAVPNDPLYSEQWGLSKIDAPAAWDVTMGSNDVVIAVIDAGIDVGHADLDGQLWVNPGEIAGNGLDDDNNGYVDDVHGWNFVEGNALLSDNTGHGTQVAGVLAAQMDNGTGVAGLCPGCRLMVLKVTQVGGFANYSDIAAAVHYAAQKGAEVISLSLGGYSDSSTLRAAVERASQSAVVVSGAGNDNKSDPFYPAAYDDWVLAVAGTDANDVKVGTCNYGAWVDVSAPGEAITTTFSGGGYGAASGTSMAVPFVAGLAGLLRSQYPGWSPNEARAQIIQTTDDLTALNPGYEHVLGSGRIDARQALQTTAQPELIYEGSTVDGETDGRPDPGSLADLDVTLSNLWADAANVHATLSSSDPYVTLVDATAAYGSIGAYEAGVNATPFRFNVAGSAPYAHAMVFALSVTADGGYAVTMPLTVTTSSGIEYVSGLIAADTTWSRDKAYVVTGNILVSSGVTLTVEPGTQVSFESGMTLQVDGTLVAIGQPGQEIRFTSSQVYPEPRDWVGIRFSDNSVDAALDGQGQYLGGSTLQHTVVEYAETGIMSAQVSPYLGHNLVQFNDIGIVAGDDASGLAPVVVYNTVEYNSTGIRMGNNAVVAYNRVIENTGCGIVVSGGTDNSYMENNLVAANHGSGLHIQDSGAISVTNNTIWGNQDTGVELDSSSLPAASFFSDNNVISNEPYDAKNMRVETVQVPLNWWGTTDTTLIDQHIYDFGDDYMLGVVNYMPYLSSPSPKAPAFLHQLGFAPASPVGIQQVTLDLVFSRPMDQSVDPTVLFYPARRGMWQEFKPDNSDIPSSSNLAVAVDVDDSKWFCHAWDGISHLDGNTWTAYNSTNSGLPAGIAREVTVAPDGSKWFVIDIEVNSSVDSSVVARFDGSTWTIYDSNNSGLPNDYVRGIAFDVDGSMWFGTGSGLVHLDGHTWTMYNSSNSGLPGNNVVDVAIDENGTKWVSIHDLGVAGFDGSIWIAYNSSNSGLPSDSVTAIAFDQDGSKWFGTHDDGTAHFDGSTWIVYNSSNSGFEYDDIVQSIAIEADGTKWFGTYQGMTRFDGKTWTAYYYPDMGGGLSIHSIAIDGEGSRWFSTQRSVLAYYSGYLYPITDHAQWVDDAHWRATYDVTSIIPRDTYKLSVSGAKGTDGVEIAPDTHLIFTVDYAGEITDQTPPNPPTVIAGGIKGDVSGVEALWLANDPDSAITGYRYAIGTAPGSTDIVNWTFVSPGGASGDVRALDSGILNRSGLGLVDGQQYWLSVQARNEGGLWSASSYSPFIAGQPLGRVFLPVVSKN